MSIFTSAVDIAIKAAAAGVEQVPVTGAGTVATQFKIFGFGATSVGEVADAVAHDHSPWVALTAIGIGLAAVALLPAASLAAATGAVVSAALPLFGGAISEAALTAIVAGVIEVGIAGAVGYVSEPIVGALANTLDDYKWAWDHPEDILPDWLLPPSDLYGKAPTQVSPLVLDLDGDGVEVTKMGYGAGASTTYFDLNNDGFAERTAWVTGGDGLLARDVNGNGKIDDQSELFGNNATYADGFANLASLDSNTSGTITAADAQWNTLRVWIDSDGDAVTDAGELKTLTELGITSINLAATAQTTLYRNENFVSDTSTFIMNGQTRAVEDVWFRNDSRATIELEASELNVATLFLPTLKGFGTLSDLHVAMSQDAGLLTLVQNFVANYSPTRFGNEASLDADLEAIMLKWAGVENLPLDYRSPNVNSRHAVFMEKLTGIVHDQAFYSSLPSVPGRATSIERAYQAVQDSFKALLLLQSGADVIFDDSSNYNIFSGDYVEGELSQSGLASLSAIAAASGNARNFWINVTDMIYQVRDPGQISTEEAGWLNSAITASSSSLSWSSISVDTLFFREIPNVNFQGTEFSDYLIGSLGADNISGLAGDDILEGGYGGDYLYSGDGNDIVAGGQGYDFIQGEAGNDTYIYNRGDGEDQFTDTSGADVIQFGEGINSGHISLQRVLGSNSATHDELNILVDGQLAINIEGFFNNANVLGKIETVRFSDNSTLDISTLGNVVGGTGNDVLNGLDRALLKSDAIYGNNGNDTLNGGDGSDFLNGGANNDTLDGGLGDDRLEGGTGDDRYMYASTANQGSDAIYDSSGIDTIQLGSIYTAANTSLVRVDRYGLAIKYGAQQLILIDKQFESSGSVIENIQYGDGSILNLLTYTHTVNGTSANETLYGTQYGAGGDIINGLEGIDILYGYDGDDALNGGAANDTLDGGLGNDTYTMNINTGSDLIVDTGGNDKLIFGAGYIQADMTLVRDASLNSLKINFGGITAVTVQGYFNSTDGQIETVEFVGGTTVDFTAIVFTQTGTSANNNIYGHNGKDALYGMDGNDSLLGYGGNDTLDGGLGNDSMSGGLGDDIYIVDSASDVVTEAASSGTDVIQSSVTYTLSANVENLTLTNSAAINGTGNTLNNTITGNSGVNTLSGGDGNDTLYGENGIDLLWADAGTDIFYGGAGADTFKFATTSIGTSDTIKDFSAAQSDVINVHDLLVGYDPLTSLITNFVEITTSGANSLLKVDRDGMGSTYTWTQIATIEGVTGMTDEAAQASAGRLVA